MIPVVIASAVRLKKLGIMAGIICLTSPDLVLESLQRRVLPPCGLRYSFWAAASMNFLSTSTARKYGSALWYVNPGP